LRPLRQGRRRGRVSVRPRVLRAPSTRRYLCARRQRDGGRTADRRRPDGGATMSLVLYNAPRCPYVARVRIVLAEKGIDYEVVDVDLDDRPAWLYEKNPAG